MNPILATCLILAVFAGPFALGAVMIFMAGRAEDKRFSEQLNKRILFSAKERRSDRLSNHRTRSSK